MTGILPSNRNGVFLSEKKNQDSVPTNRNLAHRNKGFMFMSLSQWKVIVSPHANFPANNKRGFLTDQWWLRLSNNDKRESETRFPQLERSEQWTYSYTPKSVLLISYIFMFFVRLANLQYALALKWLLKILLKIPYSMKYDYCEDFVKIYKNC